METGEEAAEDTGRAVSDQCVLSNIEHLLTRGMEDYTRRFERQQAAMMENIEFYLRHMLEILEQLVPDVETVELGHSLTRDMATFDRSPVVEPHAEQQKDAPPQRSVHSCQAAEASEDPWETGDALARQINPARARSRGGTLSSQASAHSQSLASTDRERPIFNSMRSCIEAAKRREFSSSVSSFFGSPRRNHLDVNKLDRLNMDHLIEMERCSYTSPGHGRRRKPGHSGAYEWSESSSVPCVPGDSPRLSGDRALLGDPNRWSNVVNTPHGVDADAPSESDPALRDTAVMEGGRKGTANPMHLDGVRREQEEVIISVYTADRSGVTAEKHPPLLRWPRFVLKLSGVLPLDVCRFTASCGPCVYVLCGLMLVYSLYAASMEGGSILSVVCACYASGGGLGLYLLRRAGIQSVIGTNETLLEQYAIHHGFFDVWVATCLRQLFLVGAFWIVAVACMSFFVLSMPNEDDTEGFISSTVGLASSFILSSGVVTALTYCQVHVCVGLELMVDSFCVEFLGEKKFEHGVLQWNTMQAVMRRSAQAIDLCFLAVQTLGLTATILIFMDLVVGSRQLGRTLRSLPSSLAMMAMMHFAQYRAAAVTQKCLQAPALVNSLACDGHGINVERQYMVQYITQSAAGFYVRGVRLTALMVLKVAYFCIVVTVGLAMRLSTFASDS